MKTLISIKWSNGEKSLVLFIIFLFSTQILLPNTISIEANFIVKPISFVSLLNLGYNQFTVSGLNHVLFAISFFLLCPKADEVIRQAFAFTGSYLLTEWFTVHGFIEPNTYILNSLVLLSIFFISMENIFARKLKVENSRYLFLFIFGLIHGALLGNTLVNTGFSTNAPIFSFFSYSTGVVLGEISVLALMFLIAGKFLSEKSYYKKGVVNTLSIGLAAYSIYSIVQLLFIGN